MSGGKFKKWAKRLLFGGMGVGSATFGVLMTDKGFRREVRFWSVAGPILAHYKLEKSLAKDNADKTERYKKLHARYASRANTLCCELGGMFVKAGQYFATRPEFFPEEYRNELKKCQTEVPALDIETIKGLVLKELGADCAIEIGELLGAASIGQVHIATKKDSNEKLAIKVQYPDSSWKFKADFKCLESLVWLTNEEALPIMKDLTKQYLRELDYTQEAKNLEELHDKIMSDDYWSSRVRVPELRKDLSTNRILTMSFLEGDRLLDVLTQRFGKLEGSLKNMLKRQQQVTENFRAEELNHSDDAEMNKPQQSSWWRYISRMVIDFVGVDFLISMSATVMDLFYWTSNSAPGAKSLNQLRDILDLVVEVHGFQMFNCMLFNADPHPGNLLITPDDKIGLLDFGQCKRIDHEQRKQLAQFFHSIAFSDDQEIAEHFRAFGLETKNSDDYFAAMMARLMFHRLEPKYMDHDFHIKLHKADRFVKWPSELTMVYRASALLRGLCLLLGQNISIAEIWAHQGQSFL